MPIETLLFRTFGHKRSRRDEEGVLRATHPNAKMLPIIHGRPTTLPRCRRGLRHQICYEGLRRIFEILLREHKNFDLYVGARFSDANLD